MGKLKNVRHEGFCKAYVTELNGRLFNATEAAKIAGFSKKSAHAQGCRLLKNVKVKERIDELIQETLDALNINPLYVLQKYKKILDDDIRNYLSFNKVDRSYMDDDGNEVEYHDVDVMINNSSEIDTWNISEISRGKDGQFKFKLHDKQKALDKLGEFVGMLDNHDDGSGEQSALDALVEAMTSAASNNK